jgi:hypothetical protein
MAVLTPTPADVASLRSSRTTFRRPLSDEQPVTAEQLTAATGYSEFVVTTQLAAMTASGCLETLGELHRMDTAKVRERLALMVADLPEA